MTNLIATLIIVAFVGVPLVSTVSDMWSNLETNIESAFDQ